MTPAQALKLARTRSGQSRRALAERSGTSAATLVAYESGRVQPSVTVLERILKAAGQELVIDVVPRPRIDDAPVQDTALVGQVAAIHESLHLARLAHAFGGELALGQWRSAAPAARSIDVHVFEDGDVAYRVFDALPSRIVTSFDDHVALSRGRVQLEWATTPIRIHMDGGDSAVRRIKVRRLGDVDIPLLSSTDLACRKAVAGRRQDWLDVQAMVDAGGVDLDRVVGTVVRRCGPTDARVGRLLGLRT